VETSATYVAEPVSESISHCAPTVCIQPPMLLMNCAVHISVNSRCRNGAHADPVADAALPDAGGATPMGTVSPMFLRQRSGW
jgi:hypothetical protein